MLTSRSAGKSAGSKDAKNSFHALLCRNSSLGAESR